MYCMSNKEIAFELTKHFTKNMWSRMTMQVKDPSIVTQNTQLFKKVIAAIRVAYPDDDFLDACFMIRNNILEAAKCQHCNIKLKPRIGNTKEPFTKYCSNICKSSAQANPAAEEIIVAGNRYRDFVSAMNATGLSRNTIRSRIFDHAYSDYTWAVDHETTCINKLKNYSDSLVNVDVLNEWANSSETLSSIESRTKIDSGQIRCAFSFFGITKKFEQISDEAALVRDDKETLSALYEKFNTEEIANQLGVTPKSIQNWLHHHNIPIDYSRSQSKIERDIIQFIRQLDPELEIIERDRDAIGLELDIYIPSKQVAFEFDGLYYHSALPTDRSAKYQHSTKRDLCYREGITLLQFIDVDCTDISEKLDIVKSMVANKIGANTNRIFARNCDIRIVDKKEASIFFEENHLSGYRGCSIAYGLYHKDILVSCMTFGKSIFDKKYDWEIIRFATKKYTTVVGGASRLFKNFTKHHPGSVVSYVDCQHGNGMTYKNIGMQFVRKTSPGYIYTDMKKVYSRYEFQYPSILKHCKEYDSSKTEFENAEHNGFKIYWNSGNLVYVSD